MRLETIIKIKNDYLLQRYIREHSYWYKILNRNPEAISIMNDEMRKEYKLTTEDKINNIIEKLNLVQSFMNMIK